jgi:hypothetical protein
VRKSRRLHPAGYVVRMKPPKFSERGRGWASLHLHVASHGCAYHEIASALQVQKRGWGALPPCVSCVHMRGALVVGDICALCYITVHFLAGCRLLRQVHMSPVCFQHRSVKAVHRVQELT